LGYPAAAACAPHDAAKASPQTIGLCEQGRATRATTAAEERTAASAGSAKQQPQTKTSSEQKTNHCTNKPHSKADPHDMRGHRSQAQAPPQEKPRLAGYTIERTRPSMVKEQRQAQNKRDGQNSVQELSP
jgi:hypothetical protein